jgi:hypothetical protein
VFVSVETLPFIQAVSRMIRAAGKRVADSDEFELYELYALREVLDDAIRDGVRGQLAIGRSWAHIGSALGVSRQAAQQRWGDTRSGDAVAGPDDLPLF